MHRFFLLPWLPWPHYKVVVVPYKGIDASSLASSTSSSTTSTKIRHNFIWRLRKRIIFIRITKNSLIWIVNCMMRALPWQYFFLCLYLPWKIFSRILAPTYTHWRRINFSILFKWCLFCHIWQCWWSYSLAIIDFDIHRTGRDILYRLIIFI